MRASPRSRLLLDSSREVGDCPGHAAHSGGRDWERRALEGTRTCCGDKTPEDGGDTFLSTAEECTPLPAPESPAKCVGMQTPSTAYSSASLSQVSNYPVFPTSSPKLHCSYGFRILRCVSVYHEIPLEMAETTKANVSALRSLLVQLDEEVESVLVRECTRRPKREITVKPLSSSSLLKKRGTTFGEK